MKARHQDPIFQAAYRAMQEQNATRRRGFVVPSYKAEEYRFLRKKKNCSAREAGRLLGLLGDNK